MKSNYFLVFLIIYLTANLLSLIFDSILYKSFDAALLDLLFIIPTVLLVYFLIKARARFSPLGVSNKLRTSRIFMLLIFSLYGAFYLSTGLFYLSMERFVDIYNTISVDSIIMTAEEYAKYRMEAPYYIINGAFYILLTYGSYRFFYEIFSISKEDKKCIDTRIYLAIVITFSIYSIIKFICSFSCDISIFNVSKFDFKNECLSSIFSLILNLFDICIRIMYSIIIIKVLNSIIKDAN